MSDEFIAKRKSRDEKPKKERKVKKNGKLRMGCFGRCAITCTIIFVVLISGIIGGSFWAWGKYVEPGMQMSLPRFVGIVGKAYTYSEKKLITNPYDSEVDLKAFYDGLKSKAMIDKDVVIKIEDILSGVLNKIPPTATPTPTAVKNSVSSVAPLGLQDSGTTGNAALDELLKNLKFDFSSLENYDGKPYILEITDKQIAALLNELFSSAVNSNSLKQFKDFETNYGLKLQEMVSIKQVVIDAKTVNNVAMPRLKITMMLQPRTLIGKLCEKSGTPKIVKSLVPKKIFASMSVFPNSPHVPAEVAINNVNESDFADLTSGIDGLLTSYGGSPLGIDSIFKTINDAIVSAIGSVNKLVPINFVDSGSMQAEPVKALMRMLKVTVSEGQFMNMLKDIKLPTALSLGFDKLTKELRDQNVNAFIGDFSQKYGLAKELSSTITPDNAFAQIKAITSSPNFVENINIKNAVNYKVSYQENIKNNAKVEASYMSFAGLINSYLKDNPALLGNFKATVISVDYLQNNNTIFGSDKANTDILSVLVSFDLHSMLKINTATIFGNLMAQLVPKELFVDVFLDMKNEVGYTPNAAVISVNKASIAISKSHFETLTQILVGMGQSADTLNYSAVTAKISEAVRSGITKIEEMLKAKLVFAKENLLLPNIFEVVSGTTFVNPVGLPAGSKIFSDEEVFNALAKMYAHENKEDNCIGQTGKNFAKELEQKFYIKNNRNNNGFVDKKPDGTPIAENILGDDGEKLVETLKTMPTSFQDNISIARMNNDGTATADLKPQLSENELGYIITKNAGVNISFLNDPTVVGSFVDTNLLTLVISGGIKVKESAPIPGQPPQPPKNLDGLLPKELFIKVVIDIVKLNRVLDSVVVGGDGNLIIPTDSDGVPEENKLYNCIKTITINDLDDVIKREDGMTDFERFILLVGRMSNSPIYIETIKSDLRTSLVKFLHQINAGGKMKIEFKDSAIVIDTTIFDLAVKEVYKADIDNNNLPSTPEGSKVPIPNADEFRTVIKKASLIPYEYKNAKYSNEESIIDQINERYFFNGDASDTDGQMLGGRMEYVVNVGTSLAPIWKYVDKNGNGEDGQPVEKEIIGSDGLPVKIPMTRKDINILELLSKSGLEGSYMTKVDGDKMAKGILDNTEDFYDPTNSLKLFFTKSHLARLLKGTIVVAENSGISHTEVLQVAFVPGEIVPGEAEATKKNILQIVLGGKVVNGVGGNADKYKEFIPSEVRIVVNIDYVKVMADLKKTDEQIAQEEKDEGKSKNYCTMTINNMSSVDGGDIDTASGTFKGNNLNCFVSVMNKTSGKIINLETICTEISKQIRIQSKAMTSGFEPKFVTKDGGVIDANAPLDTNGIQLGSVYDVVAEKIKGDAAQLEKAFKNLHKEVPTYGTNKDFVSSTKPIDIDKTDPISPKIVVKLNESNVGGLVNEDANMAKITAGLNGIVPLLKQVGLLNYDLPTKPTNFPFKIGNFSVDEASTDSYILVTLAVTSEKVLGNPNTLLPADIPVTICICINNDIDPLKNTVVFANLESTDKDILEKLFEANKGMTGNLDSIFGADAERKLLDSIKDLSVGTIPSDPSSRKITIGQVLSLGKISLDVNNVRWIGFEKTLADMFP